MSITEGSDLNLRVSFEPQAIREHFEGIDPDRTEGLTDAQLERIGFYAIQADSLWNLFHELLVEAFNDVDMGPAEKEESRETVRAVTSAFASEYGMGWADIIAEAIDPPDGTTDYEGRTLTFLFPYRGIQLRVLVEDVTPDSER